MYEAEAGRVHQDSKLQGGQKVGEKNWRFPSFFFRATNLLFYGLSQQKVSVIKIVVVIYNTAATPDCFESD